MSGSVAEFAPDSFLDPVEVGIARLRRVGADNQLAIFYCARVLPLPVFAVTVGEREVGAIAVPDRRRVVIAVIFYAGYSDNRAPPGFFIVRDRPTGKGYPALIEEYEPFSRPCNVHSIFDSGAATGPAIHRIDDGVCSHFCSQGGRTSVKFCAVAVSKQRAGLNGIYLVGFGGLVGITGPMDPAILIPGYGVFTGLAGAAIDDFVIVVIGIHNPGEAELLDVN